MKQKTIRLGDDFRLNNGVVEVFKYEGMADDAAMEPIYNWRPSKYKIGADLSALT